ncbi:MAG: aspartyl/asparaginyl beta-hydroxylase (cupin superfamily) [Saprospiraceae bacterium]|jgi:aspartyl/asparaginyl beta-hydroxylase (cupin superfamily)
MQRKSKIWYSFSGVKPEEYQVGFYKTKNLDWAQSLEYNFEIIRDEMLQYIENDNDRIKPYFNSRLVTEKSIWRTSAFLFWNLNFRKNQKSCPQTMKILRSIPNLVSASISILESGSTINPHRGDTNGIMRGHLPILVPKEINNIGFKVNEEEVVWEQGKLLLFNDAAYHSAWNLSSSSRIVMIIDIIRPEFASHAYHICSTILSSLIYQNISLKVKALKQLPQLIKNLFIKGFALLIYPLLRIQNI